MLFCDESNRWLTALELFTLQGFPTYPEVSPEGVRSSFAYSREARNHAPRNAAAVFNPNRKARQLRPPPPGLLASLELPANCRVAAAPKPAGA